MTTIKWDPSTGQAEILVVTAPPMVQAGLGFSVTVTAVDRFGNVVDSYGGTVELDSGDPADEMPFPHEYAGKIDGGTWRFFASLWTDGEWTITAKDLSPFGPSGQAVVTVAPAHEVVHIATYSRLVDLDYVNGFGLAVGSNVWNDPTPWTEPLVMQTEGEGWVKSRISGSTGCGRYSGTDISLSRSWSGWMSQWVGCPDYDYWNPGTYTQGMLYEYSGTKWLEPVLLPDGATVNAISMVSPTEGWAGSYSRDTSESWALKYDGEMWRKAQYLGGDQSSVLQKISFVRDIPEEGWALDSYGRPWRYLNGEWSIFNPDWWNLFGIWMTSPNDVWAVNTYDGIYHWDGVEWALSIKPPIGGVQDVSFLDANHGVAVGGYETSGSQSAPLVMSYNDGAWTQVPVPMPSGYIDMRLTAVRMVSSTDAWAVGYGWDYWGGGQLNAPILVHLKLPGSSVGPSGPTVAMSLMTAPSPLGASTMGAGASISNPRAEKANGGPLATSIEFDASEQCTATVTIMDRMMIKVASFTMTASGGTNVVHWNGQDGTGRMAGPGWHLALVEVNSGGVASRRILWFLPGTSSGKRTIVTAPGNEPRLENAGPISSISMNTKAEYSESIQGFHDMVVRSSRFSQAQSSLQKNTTPSSLAAASGVHAVEVETGEMKVIESARRPGAFIWRAR